MSRLYGRVLRQDENDWMKTMHEVKRVRPRGRPKKTWSEVIEKDCQTEQMCKEEAMDHRKRRKLIKDVA